ncbi:ankyrin repeat protein [Moumouvirus australiensis]|uniref:Ankyrin repeat protein n=1 Tax=Moumouvirus australiensis TaxID=2109587 RepID=A0A2P1EL17_9VIRU|nr:ankyrin repeat protein [Moumouvirus australiensis]AVL94565.1 ankyrin repeat protein [Moumouvirus australiensis]
MSLSYSSELFDSENIRKEIRDKFMETNIYKYYKNNKDNKSLRKIIKKYKSSYISISNNLSNIYSDLVSDTNMFDVLLDLIKINDIYENKYIYEAAVFSANYKILDELISSGLNLNMLFPSENYFDMIDQSILVQVINETDNININMVKYLINNGVDPYLYNNIAIIYGLANTNTEIFNFFKQYEIPIKDLEEAFIQYLSAVDIYQYYGSARNSNITPYNDNSDDNDFDRRIYERINYFIDAGCDINKIYQNEIEIFSRQSKNVIIYLENKQLQIDDRLINKTISGGNNVLTEYLLKQAR